MSYHNDILHLSRYYIRRGASVKTKPHAVPLAALTVPSLADAAPLSDGRMEYMQSAGNIKRDMGNSVCSICASVRSVMLVHVLCTGVIHVTLSSIHKEQDALVRPRWLPAGHMGRKCQL